jgi:hypothetical protein
MVSSGTAFLGLTVDAWMAHNTHCKWCIIGTIEDIKSGSMWFHRSCCSLY